MQLDPKAVKKVDINFLCLMNGNNLFMTHSIKGTVDNKEANEALTKPNFLKEVEDIDQSSCFFETRFNTVFLIDVIVVNNPNNAIEDLIKFLEVRASNSRSVPLNLEF